MTVSTDKKQNEGPDTRARDMALGCLFWMFAIPVAVAFAIWIVRLAWRS